MAGDLPGQLRAADCELNGLGEDLRCVREGRTEKFVCAPFLASLFWPSGHILCVPTSLQQQLSTSLRVSVVGLFLTYILSCHHYHSTNPIPPQYPPKLDSCDRFVRRLVAFKASHGLLGAPAASGAVVKSGDRGGASAGGSGGNAAAVGGAVGAQRLALPAPGPAELGGGGRGGSGLLFGGGPANDPSSVSGDEAFRSATRDAPREGAKGRSGGKRSTKDLDVPST